MNIVPATPSKTSIPTTSIPTIWTSAAQRRARRLLARGQGFAIFRVRSGDRCRIKDIEGLQVGELFVLPDVAGQEPFGRLTSASPAPQARTLADALAEAAAGRRDDVERYVARRGTAAGEIYGHRILGDAPAGTSVELEAAADALCILYVPGADMAPDAQETATPLEVTIEGAPRERARGANAAWDDLPEPLGEVKFELRIDAASARAFEVEEGDYIQIIDVDGRQCSDFLAFDAAALKDGREQGIDATTTRTLMGATTPGPGLHSKFFDERMQPLVETIQDTVGRHDTFMLACSAKYYEDMGYPGHDNCTENFNNALSAYGIAPRVGWPAINFFYNTFVEDSGAIGLDEPWSRPGDYVLLRAMKDLVCASSSCADDIDPANGWVPTDIHVRVYSKDAAFKKAIAHRVTPDAEPRLTQETGFHPRISALTRNFIDYRGYWLPTCFADEGPIAEYWACREKAVVMDLSPLRKFEVTGPDAEALMQTAVTRNLRKLAVGQVVYTAMCYDNGCMIDDGTVFRLGPQNFRWICGDDFCGIWLRQLAETRGLKAYVRTSTDQLHNIAVQGPKSRGILEQVVWTPPGQASVTELKWFRFTIGRLGGPQGRPIVISRTGYTGELGFEVWCHPKDAPEVWDAVWRVGHPLGMKPMGLSALDMVRIEAGLVFAGYDFCDQTDPFEAGIGFTVPADKPDDYVGRAALERRRANPLRRLVGLDMDGDETVGHGDCIYSGRQQIGVVTSATRSPILGKTIALARIDQANAAVGGRVEIGKLDGLQKRLGATIVAFPHFDPEKTRVRA